MPICKKCTDHFPNRMKIDGVFKMLNRRKFCLICSPYKAFNTREEKIYTTKICPKCDTKKSINEFYVKKDRLNFSTYCKECSRQDAIVRAKIIKIKCVEYKGGECQKCGYLKCIGALEFHHINRDEKEYSICQMIGFSWETIKTELDKCILLCNRCHVETEYELRYNKKDEN